MPQANILTSESIKEFTAPVVAGFSSRGPNLIFPDILKVLQNYIFLPLSVN